MIGVYKLGQDLKIIILMTNIERYKSVDKQRFRKTYVILGVAALAIIGALLKQQMTKTSSDDSLVLQKATRERSVKGFDSLLMSLQHSDLRHGETKETFEAEEKFVPCDPSKMSVMAFDNHNGTFDQCIDIKHEESETMTQLAQNSQRFSG